MYNLVTLVFGQLFLNNSWAYIVYEKKLWENAVIKFTDKENISLLFVTDIKFIFKGKCGLPHTKKSRKNQYICISFKGFLD